MRATSRCMEGRLLQPGGMMQPIWVRRWQKPWSKQIQRSIPSEGEKAMRHTLNTMSEDSSGQRDQFLPQKICLSSSEYRRPPWDHKYEGIISHGRLLGRSRVWRPSSQRWSHGHCYQVRRMGDQKMHFRLEKLQWYTILGCLQEIVSRPRRPEALQGIIGVILRRTGVD